MHCSKKAATMEDALAWTDLVASFAFEGVADVDERITEMLGHLQPAVLYFMRFVDGQHKRDHILKAQWHLLQYAPHQQLRHTTLPELFGPFLDAAGRPAHDLRHFGIG